MVRSLPSLRPRLAALALAFIACAGPASSRPPVGAAAELRVANVAKAVERDGPWDKRPDACQGFSMTAEQVRAFVLGAREVSAIQFYQERWLPCLVRAQLRSDGEPIELTISASFVAWLSYPDGWQRWLVCDQACQRTLRSDRSP